MCIHPDILEPEAEVKFRVFIGDESEQRSSKEIYEVMWCLTLSAWLLL